jgi:hypothetical protein
MTTNVKVEKTGNENNLSLIKKFTRRVRGSGILPRVRSIRYSSRPESKFVKKKKALKSIENREKINELIKLGKISEKPTRR